MTMFPMVTDNDFFEKISANKYVLIIFSTIDCGYCQLAKKNILEVIDQLDGLQIFECQIDKAQQIIKKYQVTSVPTIKFFQDGEPVYTGFGVRTPSDLYYQLKSFLPRPQEYSWPEN